MSRFVTGCMFLKPSMIAAARRAVASEVIHHSFQTMAEQPISLLGGEVELTASRVTLQPGVALPISEPPNVRYGFVLAGSLMLVNAETGAMMNFEKGDFIAEPMPNWRRGTNVGTVPVELLLIDHAQPDQRNTSPEEY
jgi:quercetin dioxygenase-like cupin family protein